MRSKNENDPHVDWTRFGKKPRKVVNAEAREEKERLGLTGRYKRFLVHVGGRTYDIPAPDVCAIRQRLQLSQGQFAEKFQISKRTIQQWEQRRAVPDMPARILLRAIESAPDVVAAAAASVRRELVAHEITAPSTNSG